MSSAISINATAFLAGLEASFEARSATNEAQAAAFERFAKRGLPNKRIEGWKWSDFNTALRNYDPNTELPETKTATADFSVLDAYEVRIVNGRIAMPDAPPPEGLEIGVIEPGAASPHMDDHSLAALNVALSRKALGFKVLTGKDLETPILVRHINTGAAPVFVQILARAEDKSRLRIIESFEGAGGFTSSMFHLGVRDGAAVERYVLNQTGPDAVIHALFGAMAGAGASLKQIGLSTGAALCRHETHVLMPDAGAHVDISSASMLGDERHCDFTAVFDHQGPGGTTRQLHKGVVKDRGRNVFQGKFFVDRKAQKTDAKMTANALLLSDLGEANHKPELEIYADDVECAHGSTIGALDEDAIFYLRQRGLDEKAARAMLVEAFLQDVLDGAGDAPVAAIFHDQITNWLNVV